jgi:hypothetical protein
MYIRYDSGRRRILRSGVIKSNDDSAKNIEGESGSNGTGGTGGNGTNHSHANKPLLDDLSVTPQNKLLVNGVAAATHMHEEAW